jgi:hypothetical protein
MLIGPSRKASHPSEREAEATRRPPPPRRASQRELVIASLLRCPATPAKRAAP